MRFLLDTNILIPLEDWNLVLQPSLSNFIRLATENHHNLLFHPASRRDIERDTNEDRRQQTLIRITRYTELEAPPPCPWNNNYTNENDAVDNEILYALERNAVSGLVTEDIEIHKKASRRGLSDRVYFIQTAEDFLQRLHSPCPVQLPNIRDIPLYQLDVANNFFDSLRAGYDGFNDWFARKSQGGTKAWVYGNEEGHPQAICIYDIQTNERINDEGETLPERALKLCTFKVGEEVRGKKIGELFLKAAFRYTSDNRIENIFITARGAEQPYLINLLSDFGFEPRGVYGLDEVYVKRHPATPPELENIEAFEYARRYFPHFKADGHVRKLIVPIRPQYHKVLFPDYVGIQGDLFRGTLSPIGNAIKLAYLCHTPMTNIHRGDILLFYRSHDLRALTSLGVVERFEISEDQEEIAGLVSRRTVYNMEEISAMAQKPTKVILFRLMEHFSRPVTHQWMNTNEIVEGNIQSFRALEDQPFQRVIGYARS